MKSESTARASGEATRAKRKSRGLEGGDFRAIVAVVSSEASYQRCV